MLFDQTYTQPSGSGSRGGGGRLCESSAGGGGGGGFSGCVVCGMNADEVDDVDVIVISGVVDGFGFEGGC